MTYGLALVAAWLSALASFLGRFLLGWIGLVPGWVSATAVGAVTGVLMLAMFKYTSDQNAIKRVRKNIDANLLALKLFKDSARVALKAQGRVLDGAVSLLVLALVPMLVMALPMTLLLVQLSLWYEARPLVPGEEAVISLKLGGDSGSAWPAVSLEPTAAVEVIAGPVRMRKEREVCWNVKAKQPGGHRLLFQVGDQSVVKELAIGDGFMRVSTERPGWNWSRILLNPWEEPFRPGEPVRSIAINYPERSSYTSGSGYWVIYWFAVSMVAALCFKGVLKVNI
jgi:hypothetical protein